MTITGGVSPYTISFQAGFPTGLTATLSGSTISFTGTPTATGTFASANVTIKDSVGASASKMFSITINPAPAIGSLSASAWTVNQGGYNGTMTVSGGTPPFALPSQNDLPPGLTATISGSTITITGTPTATGTFSDARVLIEDHADATANKMFSITINPEPAIGSLSNDTWTVNQPGFDGTMAISGGTAPFSITSQSGIPPGLAPTLSAGAIGFTGTPTTAGTFSSGSVTIKDMVGATVSKTFSISIQAASPTPTATASPTPTATATATPTASATATPAATATVTATATPTATATATPAATATATPTATATVTATATATATPIVTATATPTATATATPTAAPGLVGNVSTRLSVGTEENVLIEGFIVQGPAGSTKKILVRALGPSLTSFGIADAVANPSLDIFDSLNTRVASNNDWKTTQIGGLLTSDQSAEIQGSGVAPGNDLESAIVANLASGSYTAVVRGAGNTTGTGVVDAFDLSGASANRLANIATRGLVQAGDKLMIAGFIIQNGPVRLVVRAIGPSLLAFGITNALLDTTLQLHDGNGAIVMENDNWKTIQQAELEGTGLQPTSDLEAAVVTTIPPGQYTAQVRGKDDSVGIGVVEVYFLQ